MTAKTSQILDRLEERWNQVAPAPARRLLRLALVREFAQAIHTLRSEVMATDHRENGETLAGQEEFLMASLLQGLPFEDMAIRDLRQRRSPPNREKRSPPLPELVLPPELCLGLDPAKLRRHDRVWEMELCREALARGWWFWKFEASVEIHGVEEFAHFFSDSLWPRGVVLFVESDGFLKTSFWRGRWTLVLDPAVPDARELSPGFVKALIQRWPGSDPRWTRIYPPP